MTATVPAVDSTMLGQELSLRTMGSGALDVRSSADQYLNTALAKIVPRNQVNVSRQRASLSGMAEPLACGVDRPDLSQHHSPRTVVPEIHQFLPGETNDVHNKAPRKGRKLSGTAQS